MEAIVLHKYNKQELMSIFSDILVQSGFSITECNIETNEISIKDGIRNFIVRLIIKNISPCGWEAKETLYRIQVANVKDSIIPTNNVKTHMLCGIADYKGNIILVVWNSYRYLKHNTQRSCYVYEKSFEKCLDNGYVMVRDFGQETWLCEKNKFSLLIRDYIYYNNVGE